MVTRAPCRVKNALLAKCPKYNASVFGWLFTDIRTSMQRRRARIQILEPYWLLLPRWVRVAAYSYLSAEIACLGAMAIGEYFVPPLAVPALIALFGVGALFLPIALLGNFWLMRSIGWARRGMCRRCGYDLRATLERCPECGLEDLPPISVRGRAGSQL